jgi:hypothetical protein
MHVLLDVAHRARPFWRRFYTEVRCIPRHQRRKGRAGESDICAWSQCPVPGPLQQTVHGTVAFPTGVLEGPPRERGPLNPNETCVLSPCSRVFHGTLCSSATAKACKAMSLKFRSVAPLHCAGVRACVWVGVGVCMWVCACACVCQRMRGCRPWRIILAL